MGKRFGKICWVFSLALLLLGCDARANNHLAQPIPPGRDFALLSLLPLSTSDFGRFVGTWVAHGSLLTFSTDGQATFLARTYNWCGPDVSSRCDSIDAQGHILAGDQEHMLFSRVIDSVAYGTITSSNFHPTGLAVTVALQSDDTLLYASNTEIARLCGPTSPPGLCGA